MTRLRSRDDRRRSAAPFVDETELVVRGGDGGNGAVAFRREKFVPRGGPSGGHGGAGGDVVLAADPGVNTLYPLLFRRHVRAGRGGHGGGAEKHGRRGDDVVLSVPVGTVVIDAASGEVLADLVHPGDRVVVARGGRGGRGNSAFKSPTQQAPRFAERGEPGQERRLRLELKVLADVGIVGMPNAGKSTLLARISAASPKIGDYPFTTLAPNLGVAEVGYQRLVFADLPGLIVGAHRGAGLGDRFLRHIERTRVLVHLLDGTSDDPLADWQAIGAELAAYSPDLACRPQVVAFNKIDLPAVRERWPDIEARLRDAGCDYCVAISAATGENLERLLRLVANLLARLPAAGPPSVALPVLRPAALDEEAFHIERLPDGSFRVSGRRIERTAAMTDWSCEPAVARFDRVVEAMGVADALRAAGIREGDTVRIGNVELEWSA